MDAWTFARVLDHGFVSLVDSMPHYSSDGYDQLTAADRRVVAAARVSTSYLPPELLRPADTQDYIEAAAEPPREAAKDEKLIDYLMKHRHTSPFEKVRFEFAMRLPIFVARQIVRHRTGSFNEQSARYSELADRFYVPDARRIARQSSTNKQASGEPLHADIAESAVTLIHDASTRAYRDYTALLHLGVSREIARVVLPVNIYTQWYWTIDLHNLMHFLKLRLHEHAQYEVRVYAEAIAHMAERVAPVSMAAWRRHVLGEV